MFVLMMNPIVSFWLFSQLGKCGMELTFYQQIQTWESISLSLHVTNFLIVCRVAMVTQQ